MKKIQKLKIAVLAIMLDIPVLYADEIDIPIDGDPGDELPIDLYLPFLAIMAVCVAYFWFRKQQKSEMN